MLSTGNGEKFINRKTSFDKKEVLAILMPRVSFKIFALTVMCNIFSMLLSGSIVVLSSIKFDFIADFRLVLFAGIGLSFLLLAKREYHISRIFSAQYAYKEKKFTGAIALGAAFSALVCVALSFYLPDVVSSTAMHISTLAAGSVFTLLTGVAICFDILRMRARKSSVYDYTCCMHFQRKSAEVRSYISKMEAGYEKYRVPESFKPSSVNDTAQNNNVENKSEKMENESRKDSYTHSIK